MSDEPDQEVVCCRQCDWPMRRGEPFTIVSLLCPDCGEVHGVGVVHTDICALAMATGADRPDTQRRRAGIMGLN